MIFRTAICAEASQMCPYRRAKSDIQLASSANKRFGMEISMINFEEELAKFKPSLEISEAEEEIYNNDLTDVNDIIKELIEEVKDNK